jgi:hypothetical protein
MANIGFSVKADDLPEAQDFTPVPAGTYTAMIVNSSLRATNKTKEIMPPGMEYEEFLKSNPKAAGYLALEIDLLDGGAAGRKLFHNLNLINDNEKAVEIAFGQLKQILTTFGMGTWSGKSEELHNKRLSVTVAVEQGKPYLNNGVEVEGKPQNNIKKFAPAGAASVSAVAGTPTPAAAEGGPAWKRK